jgi:hypothetical protein
MEKLINNNFIWYILFIFIILIFFSNNHKFNKTNEKFSTFSNGFLTESSNQGSIVCAKSCCNSGWPSSIELDEIRFGIKSGDMGTKYRASNLSCSNGFTTGCVCVNI